MTDFRPELLSPAGTFRNMQFAYAYGADAVYAGQPRYSLRVRNNGFDMDNLRRGIEYAHARGKQFFVASNLIAHDNKVRTYLRDMEPIIEMRPDALIMADPGLIMLVRERWPEQTIHLSVQASTLNAAAVKFWQQVGLERVILSRELSLDEIESIRQACPDMELEVFVHGALCIAYSGRCLLSGYFNKRDPNQGACTNACRWNYGVHQGLEDVSGDVHKLSELANSGAESRGGVLKFDPAEQTYLLEEQGRPGELMPVFEDEHGTYIMNSKDLRAIQHVQRLIEIGVDSLKIEGRTKTHFYAARTAQLYRRAIDDALAGRDFDKDLMVALDGMANRGYTEGFYRRHVPEAYQNYAQGSSQSGRQQFVGEILAADAARGTLDIEVKNKFALGDTLELMLPQGNQRFELASMESLRGERREVAPGSGHQVRIQVPQALHGELEMGLLLVDR